MNSISKMTPHILTTKFVSNIDEDSLTVVELSSRIVAKVNECAVILNNLCEQYEELITRLGFSVESGELSLSVQQEFEAIKRDSLALVKETRSAYNTDALSAIELAGCTANQVNKCASLINRLVNNVDSMGDALGLHVENEELFLNKGE